MIVTFRYRRKRCSSAKTHISTTHNKDFTHYIVNVATHRLTFCLILRHNSCINSLCSKLNSTHLSPFVKSFAYNDKLFLVTIKKCIQII
jgi:hypothetical protein